MKNCVFLISSILLVTLLLFSCVGANRDIYYGFSKSGSISNFNTPALRARHLEMVNALRVENGLKTLKLSNELSASAKTHALDMARQQRAWNYGSDASSPQDRAIVSGFSGLILGENVSETYEGEYDVLDVWFKYSLSRSILLDPKASHVGFSWYQDDKGKVWWVQEIGLLY